MKILTSRNRRKLLVPALALMLTAISASAAEAQRFDPTPVWPLCGNITDLGNTPPGWILGHDCPADRAGDPSYADRPISDTFGPRLAGNAKDFDWHRGIDIPTDNGTPVFAVSAGEVVTVSNPTVDKTIMLRHARPGNDPNDLCHPNGCYFSRYRHLSHIESDVFVGATVARGQYIGQTGRPSGSSFYHLHLEIRSAIDAEADGSQREAIHPLSVLPRGETGSGGVDGTLTVTFETDLDVHGTSDPVDDSDPLLPEATVKVTLPDASQELDLERVELTVYENRDTMLSVVPQPNDFSGSTSTPENEAWQVNPARFGIEAWTRHYTYKNSYGISFSDFETGGDHESPWHLDLPGSWSGTSTPDFHLTHRKYDDTGVSDDRKLLAFNGVEVYAPKFNATNSYNQYQLYITFKELDGVADAADLCLEAVAFDVDGNRSPVARWGNCTVTP